MSAITATPQTFSFTPIRLPTQRATATGLLLLTAVVLFAFASVVIQITHQAGVARDASTQVHHARVGCESHALAGARDGCRQSLAVTVLSR